MGPENSCSEKIIWAEVNGEWNKLPRPIENADFDDYEIVTLKYSFPVINGTFTINIFNKFHMSAKRFKKLLMSRGLSRDDADWLCYTVGTMNGKVSYYDIYLNVLFFGRTVSYYEVFDYILTKGECAEWIATK